MPSMCACAGVFWGVWQGVQGLGSPRSSCSERRWEKDASGAWLWQSRLALVQGVCILSILAAFRERQILRVG